MLDINYVIRADVTDSGVVLSGRSCVESNLLAHRARMLPRAPSMGERSDDHEALAAEARVWQLFGRQFVDDMIAAEVCFVAGWYWMPEGYTLSRDAVRRAVGDAASGASLPGSFRRSANKVIPMRIDGIEKSLAQATFAKVAPSAVDPKSIERREMLAGDTDRAAS